MPLRAFVRCSAPQRRRRATLRHFRGADTDLSVQWTEERLRLHLVLPKRSSPAEYPSTLSLAKYRKLLATTPIDQRHRARVFHLNKKEVLAKALELDDSIGEAHYALGLLRWRFDWDRYAADRELNRAIALSPSYSCFHEVRAIFLAFTGRRAEGLAEITRINLLDYSLSSAMAESITYCGLRDYPGLVQASKRGLLLDRQDAFPHYLLGVGYEGTNKLPEAISEYQNATKMWDGPSAALALAHAYSTAGRKAQANKILRDLQRKSKETSVPPYTPATIYAGLGENDKAFEFLEKAYSEKSLDISLFLKSDLLLDSLRPDPRFQSLLRRIGLTALLPRGNFVFRILRAGTFELRQA
jgi:tetratricopeptide (TPR) repeat protein